MLNDVDYNLICKLLVVGDSSVGKSCMLLRYSDDRFLENHMATIGVDFKLKKESVGNYKAKIQIWDTGYRFRSITAGYYKGAQGILIVFDVTNRESFEHVKSWYEEVKQNTQEGICIVLCGNKADMEKDRVVSTAEGESLANQLGIPFFETSAKNDYNIHVAFRKLIETCIKHQTLGKKSNTPGVTTLDEEKKSSEHGCCGF
ncbi:rab family small GTPase [Naegleria gruberi]|uniref:Rab family small GTPase n=1 Tax=Naegleria gruberi TaxID=5762 RepID=D2VIR9_NAEGR|nr:rab family small GTPase [Naegleria gruberi]EFC43399.1 rab family small GTPase [Naegleria gruberi]|eukprot:XP_002676143.1 rab family small GTPase [Naegleria gruberi strain NEG-M]